MDLTYRADLRELNELNFTRFDAKLEQRITGLGSELRQTAAELRAELRLEFRTELQQVRTELLRWMFGFWVTTLVTLGGLIIGVRGT